MQSETSTIVSALSSLAIFLAGGLAGWISTGFVGRPILDFFELRRKARQYCLMLWDAPHHGLNYTPLEHRRFMEKLEEPRNRLKSIGAEILAFSQSNRLAAKIVKLFGFDPASAGKAIDTIVRQLGTDIEDRDENYKKLDRALKFRIGKSGKFYDPHKSD